MSGCEVPAKVREEWPAGPRNPPRDQWPKFCPLCASPLDEYCWSGSSGDTFFRELICWNGSHFKGLRRFVAIATPSGVHYAFNFWGERQPQPAAKFDRATGRKL